VRSILDAHYLHRDPELARTAVHKLEMGMRMASRTTPRRRKQERNSQMALKAVVPF
jgi:hypothetical protein